MGHIASDLGTFQVEKKDLTAFFKETRSLLEGKSSDELSAWFTKILNGGIHGLCFSIYEEGQQPGDLILPEQVRKRLALIKNHTNWVRSFSCIEGNEWVPRLAKEMGMKTLVGAWLGDDEAKNEKEIDNLIKLANEGVVDIAAVGNEVLYRNDMSKEDLLDYIKEVKSALPNIPVGYVDAYYEFTRHPDLVEASDVILTNCYPFWEGTPIEYALPHMQSMYSQTKNVAKGKKVIITETGWPNAGQAVGGSLPSHINALNYFLYTQFWAKEEGIEVFYFSSFDEAWKVGSEGDVGAYWGIWDKDGRLKF